MGALTIPALAMAKSISTNSRQLLMSRPTRALGRGASSSNALAKRVERSPTSAKLKLRSPSTTATRSA
jgi:hypothetical protein